MKSHLPTEEEIEESTKDNWHIDEGRIKNKWWRIGVEDAIKHIVKDGYLRLWFGQGGDQFGLVTPEQVEISFVLVEGGPSSSTLWVSTPLIDLLRDAISEHDSEKQAREVLIKQLESLVFSLKHPQQ